MDKKINRYLPVAAPLAASAIMIQPVQAQVSSDDAVAEVTGVITSLGVIALAAIAVAVGPMAFSMGARIFRKVMR